MALSRLAGLAGLFGWLAGLAGLALLAGLAGWLGWAGCAAAATCAMHPHPAVASVNHLLADTAQAQVGPGPVPGSQGPPVLSQRNPSQRMLPEKVKDFINVHTTKSTEFITNFRVILFQFI